MIRVFGDATDGFSRLRFLFDRAFNLLAILLVVVFQPELRAAMGRLGRAQFSPPAARRLRVLPRKSPTPPSSSPATVSAPSS